MYLRSHCTVCLCCDLLQEFMFARSMDGSNLEDIQEFMDESIRGHIHIVPLRLLCGNNYVIYVYIHQGFKVREGIWTTSGCAF